MESKNFTYDMDHKLIEHVKKHPYLYKATEKKFRDNVLRDQVWHDISKSMSRTVAECKTRWRTMRDSYRKNRKKARAGKRTPSRSKYDDDNLRFLDEVPPKRRRKLASKMKRDEPFESHPIILSSTSLAVDSDGHLVAMEGVVEGEVMGGEVDVAEVEENIGEDERNDVKVMLYRATTPDPERPESDSIVLQPPTSAEHAVSEEAIALEELRRDINERFQLLQERLLNEKRAEKTEHPVEIFFRSMASTVMTFSPHLIAEAKVNVCKIISELELRNLTEDSRDGSRK